jgi:hypothetical protein
MRYANKIQHFAAYKKHTSITKPGTISEQKDEKKSSKPMVQKKKKKKKKNQSGIAILISNKIDFQPKGIKHDEGENPPRKYHF